MIWKFERTSLSNLRVTATARDGSSNVVFSTNVATTNAAIDTFRWYVSGLTAGDQRQPYFDKLEFGDLTPPTISLKAGVTSPTLLAIGATPPALGAADVDVADNLDTNPAVTVSPGDVSTSMPGNVVVTYTATDSAGNTASVTRQFIIGDGGGNTDYTLNSPPTMSLFKGSSNGVVVSARIKIPGLTDGALAASNVICDIGVNAADTDPSTWGTNVWKRASLAPDWTSDDFDEHRLLLRGVDVPQTNGTYYYAARWQFGGTHLYGGITTSGAGGKWNGTPFGNGVLSLSAADAFSDWLGNAPSTPQALAEYAYGAGAPGTLPPEFRPKGTNAYAGWISLEFCVRDGLTNVTVTPQWSTNLTTDRTGFAAVDSSLIEEQGTVTVPGGSTGKKFLVSVPIDSNKKKFLQLKIVRTLPPE